MRSLQAFTNEVDDIDMAVSELNAGIDTSLFLKNTCGIIFCPPALRATALLLQTKMPKEELMKDVSRRI